MVDIRTLFFKNINENIYSGVFDSDLRSGSSDYEYIILGYI